jgi:hypothetical protein
VAIGCKLISIGLFKISELLTGEIKISKLEVRSKVIFGSLCKPA